MLTDIPVGPPDATTQLVAAILGNKTHVEHIGTGMYLTRDWNFELRLGSRCVSKYPSRLLDGDLAAMIAHDRAYEEAGMPNDCGVCDSPEQFIEKYGDALNAYPRPLVVSFVHLTKADQPAEGGWRWRKWGEYIGDQNPRCEYLANEPDITDVYTFHVYEVKP